MTYLVTTARACGAGNEILAMGSGRVTAKRGRHVLRSSSTLAQGASTMTKPTAMSRLSELTLEEKTSLLSGSGFWHTKAIDRVGLASIMVSDGPHGLRVQPSAGDHVGIGGSLPATCFPTASALGSSFDRDLVGEVGAAIGREAQAQGVAVVLGPGINLKRTPLCGRNFEYLSEDPVVAGILGGALVEGIQSQGVGASLKHFAANNQETERLRISAVVDDVTLRELYLLAFERVVRTTQPWTVMCSYNKINGVYASQDPWLLTEVLRETWGFEGLVVSDWGAVDDPVAAVAAGLDLEMPSSHGFGPRKIAAAVADGALSEQILDAAVERVLTLLDKAAGGRVADIEMPVDAHHTLARRAAAASVVLLRNDHELLPLRPDLESIAVIGAFAAQPRFQGAGSSKVNPTRIDMALDALRAALGATTTVSYAPGFGIDDDTVDLTALQEEALSVARDADVVVAFLGLPPSFESEGFDRQHLDLPGEQLELLAKVAAVNPRVVVVLANGGVVTTAALEPYAQALVEGWLGGQAGGAGVVDVLVGAVNPSGRLAETIPLRLEDTPAFVNFPGANGEVHYGERTFIGYRHYDLVDREVGYPFGHGLSYTTFSYGDFTVSVEAPTADHAEWRGAVRIRASVSVTNTGDVAGAEVVQCYLSELGAPHPRAVRVLKDFAKITLAPGETSTVHFTLRDRDLARWSTTTGSWIVTPGAFTVAVGASSRDLRAEATVTVEGEAPVFALDATSTMAEWLAHPAGRILLTEGLRNAPGGNLSFLLDDPDTVMMLGSFPLHRLAVMMGDALGEGFAEELRSTLDAS